MNFWNIDWAQLFIPDIPITETIIRGTVVYLVLFFLLRIVLKRETGTVGITDLVVVFLLANAAQNAISGPYNSITNGVILVATIIFWSYVLDWLSYRYPTVRRLIHPTPLLLIKEGKIIPSNLRKEFITEDELESMLREEGVSDVGEVSEAYMEGDGRISILTNDKKRPKKPEQRTAA